MMDILSDFYRYLFIFRNFHQDAIQKDLFLLHLLDLCEIS